MLRVDFKIDDKLAAELSKLSRDTTIGTVLIHINNEEMHLLDDVLVSSGDLATDLESVRQILTCAEVQCAYVVQRLATQRLGLITFVTDATKARERMLYSSGVGHLQQQLSDFQVRAVQASAIADITPTLFRAHESGADREALMTESERLQAQIECMEPAPRPTALPGVTLRLSTDAAARMEAFSHDKEGTVTFAVADDTIKVDKTLQPLQATLRAVQQVIPEDHPRFVLTHFARTDPPFPGKLMVYVCPAKCRPREKMSYAAAKACFMQHAQEHGIRFDRKLDVGDWDDLLDLLPQS